MNTYNPFPPSTPELTARRKVACRVLESLYKNNVSVVARSLYGKSALLKHIAAAARKSGRFNQVVEWDLRHFTPHEDGEFFEAMCNVISSQLVGALLTDAKEFLSTKGAQDASTVRMLLEIMEASGETLLLVMDGLDDPLASSGLSKGVWDHLCAFTDKGSLRILAGSRARLRELCINPSSKTSDFFRRFDDPVTTLGAFDSEELSDYLQKLEGDRPLEKGGRTEFERQTGGIPLLCAALARKLGVLPEGTISQKLVLEAANQIADEDTETLPSAFAALAENERMSYAEVIARGTMDGNHGTVEKSLRTLGLIRLNGGKLESACGMLAGFVKGQSESLCSIRDLFGTPEGYERNIRSVSSLRSAQCKVKDTDLQDFIARALSDQGSPKVFLTTIRGIIEHTLTMLWSVEAPNQELPRFTSGVGLAFLGNCDFGRLPLDPPKQLRCLDLLTDSRNGVTPKKVNRKIYCLLNALKGFGDLGQHQQGLSITSGFAGVVCLTVVELSNELGEAGF